MTLYEITEIWALEHDEPFWDVFTLPEALSKDVLIDYILYEYGDRRPIDTNSGHFRNRIRMFFQVHEWNIVKLTKTLLFRYDPLADSRWHDKYRWYKDDVTDFTSVRDIHEVEQNIHGEIVDSTSNEVVDFDSSENNTVKTVEDSYETDNSDGRKHEDKGYEEHVNYDDTKVHYVSAYNLDLSPSGNPPTFKDSEEYRDTDKSKTDTTGEHSIDNTYHDTTTKDLDVTTDVTEKKKGTEDTVTDYHNTDDIDWTRDRTETIDDDLITQEILDSQIERDTWHHGNNSHSFQSLINEEREQAQFNIYKWIGRHFSLELLICVW